jgi:hypothetical protein
MIPLSIMQLSIMTRGKMTISINTTSIMAFIKITPRILSLSIMILRVPTCDRAALGTMTLSLTTLTIISKVGSFGRITLCYTQWRYAKVL